MKKILFCIFSIMLVMIACGDDDLDEMNVCNIPGDLSSIEYNPVAYELSVPASFGEMFIPIDNALTVQGISLGRHLFFDPILSADSTMACATCHLNEGSFTDNLAVSTGIDGIAGSRSSMALLNVGYFYNGLFWDGRSATLEDQALLPVEDPIEMHNTWPNLIAKLKVHPSYPGLFREAFGIENISEITKELAARAIAQFERILVSSGESKYDLVENATPGQFYTEAEAKGRELFFIEFAQQGVTHPGCSHCHEGVLLTNDAYENNGIEQVNSLDDFPDLGRFEVTGLNNDKGKFRVPTLRNIEFSAPYMHDGRFETLEEVIDHYASGGFFAENINPNIKPFVISEEDKANLVAFLKTLSDPVFMNNPDFRNPF